MAHDHLPPCPPHHQSNKTDSQGPNCRSLLRPRFVLVERGRVAALVDGVARIGFERVGDAVRGLFVGCGFGAGQARMLGAVIGSGCVIVHGSSVLAAEEVVQVVAGGREEQRAGRQAAVHGAQVGEKLVEHQVTAVAEGGGCLVDQGGDEIGQGGGDLHGAVDRRVQLGQAGRLCGQAAPGRGQVVAGIFQQGAADRVWHTMAGPLVGE